ncbi:MAG: hypothetical protein LBT03_02050 [Holosporales bacterium]|nr:hypothetical protein [Holosporales bacterium]
MMFSSCNTGDPDIQALLQDSYFNALVNWDNTSDMKQEKLQAKHPETVDLDEQ